MLAWEIGRPRARPGHFTKTPVFDVSEQIRGIKLLDLGLRIYSTYHHAAYPS